MKKEIVYTDKYALILSDEKPSYGGIIFEDISGILSPYEEGDIVKNPKTIIAHLPLSDAPILEGVPLLPPLPKEDDVNKLAYEKWKKSDERSGNPPYIYGVGFNEGYNKAKEKYKYTEEDVRKAFHTGRLYMAREGDTTIEQFIQSLQQPSRPTHFECETTPMDLDEIREKGSGFLNANIYKIKTTTNSQGQIELVGKYL